MGGKHGVFTEEDVTALLMEKAGHSHTEIAKKIGSTRSTVQRRLEKLVTKIDEINAASEFVSKNYTAVTDAYIGMLLESLVGRVDELKDIPLDKVVKMIKDLRSTTAPAVEEVKNSPITAFFNAIPVEQKEPETIEDK